MKKIKLIVLFLAVCFGYEDGHSQDPIDVERIDSLVYSDTVIYLQNIRLDTFELPSKEKLKSVDNKMSQEEIAVAVSEVAFVTGVISPTQFNFQGFKDDVPPGFFLDKKNWELLHCLYDVINKYIEKIHWYNDRFEQLFTFDGSYISLSQNNTVLRSFLEAYGRNRKNFDLVSCFNECFNKYLRTIGNAKERFNCILLEFYKKLILEEKDNVQSTTAPSEKELNRWNDLKKWRDETLRLLNDENERFEKNVERLAKIKGMPSKQSLVLLNLLFGSLFR